MALALALNDTDQVAMDGRTTVKCNFESCCSSSFKGRTKIEEMILPAYNG
jgi:hypothetical protein